MNIVIIKESRLEYELKISVLNKLSQVLKSTKNKETRKKEMMIAEVRYKLLPHLQAKKILVINVEIIVLHNARYFTAAISKSHKQRTTMSD